MNELRELLISKEKFLESLEKSQKATYLNELIAEKEEYYAEIQRLRSRLDATDHEVIGLRSRINVNRGASSEGILPE